MRLRSLIVVALLASCAPSGEPAENDQASRQAAAPAEPAENAMAQPIEPAGDPKSADAALRILRTYFSLVGQGRASEAAKLWWDETRADEFAGRLRGLGEFRPSIATPGRIEGAAGSAYISISLQLLRDARSGTTTLSDGTAVLRRINDVPGSTAEQRRWRIDRISLQPAPQPIAYRFVGRWATEERNCAARAWRFTATSLQTPACSVCSFSKVSEVPGGYDITATCTAEGPARDDVLQLRFAESARALLFESQTIADAGLVRCR